MKRIRLIAMCMAVLLIAGGCAKRSDQSSSSVPEVIPEIESKVEEFKSEAEQEASKIESEVESAVEPESESEPEQSKDEDESLDEPTSSPAMNADFSAISGLNTTLDNGFPGGPVDDQNRPSGPIGYQGKYGKYDAHFIVPNSKKIYLTIDEGYENGYTANILDVLKEKNVKAVFFITYPYAKTETALVQRMIDEGHTLGNHSTAHKSFPTMPLSEAADDIMNLHDYVKVNYGYEMFLFRPPEGGFSEQTLALTESLGYKSVLWSFAYKDYDVNNQPITIEATDTIVRKAHPGEIALIHAVSKTNSEILGDVIDQIRAKGFEFADYFMFEKTE